MRRAAVALSMLATGAGLLGAHSAPGGHDAAEIRRGGIFRISFTRVDHVDPALAQSFQAVSLLDATCARLMNYPDRNPPAGYQLEPEVAASFPRVSNGGLTYTFTIRRGLRFSDGRPVRADAFARAIARIREYGDRSPGTLYTQDIAAVSARGRRLVITLRRALPDFPARMTIPVFCAVPPNLPADPEGATRFHSAGPYYIAEYVRGRRVVLRRNRFYRGARPQHVDRFDVDVQAVSFESVAERIERNQADWGILTPPVAFDPARRLIARYGINRSRFFLRAGLGLRGFYLNTSGPLFRNNPRLRRAVNFAIDRRAIRRAALGPLEGRIAVPTDQYLPPGLPGFKDVRIYPLDSPNVRRAGLLARGHRRAGKAVFYAANNPVAISHGQIIRDNLARIGLDVEVKVFPIEVLIRRLLAPGEPWDIAPLALEPPYIDPSAYINVLLDGRFVGEWPNVARFNSPTYNRRMRRAAALRGRARFRAYADLDVRLARDAAPLVASSFVNEPTFVSRRVDRRCVVLRPRLDLAAVCLKR